MIYKFLKVFLDGIGQVSNMGNTRIGEIAKPLDKLFEQYGFEIDEDVMEEGSTRMASFTHPNGMEIDYVLEVRKDVDEGDYASSSDFSLNARLYKGGEPIELYPTCGVSSNMPITTLLKEAIRDTVEPNMRKHIPTSS